MQRPPLPPSELTFRPSLPGGWISSSTIGRDSSQTSNSDREIPRSFPPLDVITAGAEATEASDGGEVVDAHSDTGELSKGAAVKRQEETAASQPGQERAIAGGAASTFPVRSSLAAPDATGVRNLGNAPDDRPPPGNDDLPPPPPPKDSPAEKVSYEAQTRPSKIPPSEAGNIPPGNSSDDVAQDDLPTPVPLSTDASPFDEESDRLRKEIVRSLNAPAFSNPSVVTSHPGQAPRESFQMLADAKQPGLERESSIFPSEYDSYWASDHDTPRLAVPGITMGKEREGLVGDVTENLPIPLSVDAEGRGQSHDRQLDPNLGYDAQKRDGGSTVDHPIKAVPHEVHSPQEHEDEAYPGAVESTASAELDQSSSEASTTVVPGHLGSEAPLPHLRTEDDKAPAAEAPPAESTPEDQKQLRPDNFGVSPSSSVSVGDRHDLGIQHFDADTGRLAAPDAPTTETNQEANLQATTPTSSSTAQDSPDTGAQTTHLNSGNLHELIRFTEAEPMLIHASIPQMSSSDKRSRDRDSAPPPDDSLLETVRLAESPPLHIQPPGSATEEVAPPSAEPKSAPRDNGPPSERFPVEARSTRLAAALPASALRVPTTQDIAVMPTALERIQAYDRVRKHHANLSTGLAAWLAARTTKEPARGGVVPSTSAIPRLDTSAPASDSAPSTPTARPATDTSPAGSSTADQPYYQQYLHFSDYPPASGAAKISPTTTGTGPAPSALYAGSSTNKITAGQVQAKGKELLHSAGVLGGKANVAAKGFFAKGKSKWRASTADKVDH
ncbi:MAG: hypothetical protein M1826_000304 [Phylliscum demangeonii]|nr:MAG: hypothetical protein M1826_000304 [Phylliscum demangeonii]